MSDLFSLEKEAEFFERDEVVTSSEMEQLELDEDLPDFERALQLLNHGVSAQKISALSTIVSVLASEKTRERLILVIDSIKDIHMKHDLAEDDPQVLIEIILSAMRFACADGKGKITHCNFLFEEEMNKSEYLNNVTEKSKQMHIEIETQESSDFLLTKAEITEIILPFALSCYETMQSEDELRNITHCLISILPRLSGSLEETKILEIATAMGALSKSIRSRISCCQILGAIVTWKLVPINIIEDKLFPKMVDLCQDTSEGVRMAMCNQLSALARSISIEKASFELLPELLELLQDEEAQVKCTAFEALVDLIDFYPDNERKTQIIPVLVEITRNIPNHLLQVFAKNFGVVVYKLSLSNDMGNENKSSFEKSFSQLSINKDDQIRKFCSFNFPAILKAFGASHYASQLDELLQLLSQDKCSVVRKSVAAGIHEIASLLGQQRVIKYLKTLTINLLKDESLDVRNMVIARMTDILKFFTNIVDPEQKLMFLEHVLSGVCNFNSALPQCKWRKRVEFFKSIFDFPMWFSSAQIHERITPLLFHHMHSDSLPVQLAASRTLINYIRRNDVPYQRNQLIGNIREEFAQGRSCWQRMLYLDTCIFALEFNSRKYFRSNFLDAAVDLAEDAVPSVRMKARGLLPLWKLVLSNPSENRLMEKINNLLNSDTSKDSNTSFENLQNPNIVVVEHVQRLRDSIFAHSDAIYPSFLSTDEEKLQEEERLLMSEDHERTSFDSKWSDMLEYTLVVGKDGQMVRRARVRSLELLKSPASAYRGNDTKPSSSTSKVKVVSSSLNSSRNSSYQLPSCATGKSSSVVKHRNSIQNSSGLNSNNNLKIPNIPAAVVVPTRPLSKRPTSPFTNDSHQCSTSSSNSIGHNSSNRSRPSSVNAKARVTPLHKK